MSPETLSMRRLIRRLHQSNTTAEERRCLVEISSQAALLTPEEAATLSQDPTQLNADQHYRIWDWVHRWEREHRHDESEWAPYPERHND